MLGDDPPYLSVGTEVSAKYKGAFCEAKIRKVVRSVKCRVTYKQGLGTATVTDDQIKGTLRVSATVEAKHADRKDFVEATITKIQDCSQYTVVFDDGDITTLRRTALCLKSGRHFAASETLDQLPLTHPEHFGNPVIGGRRGRRSRQAQDDSSEDEGSPPRGSRDSGSGVGGKEGVETEPEIGRVVCVELGDKKKKDYWFPGLVVAPTAQDTVRIRVRDDYLVRSFKDARYYTVPKKEAIEFTKAMGNKLENSSVKVAVEKALLFLEKNELPPHWDRDSLFGNTVSSGNSDSDADLDSDSSDDEPREEKDHFVAQLYKFMDDRGTPINNCPMIGTEDIDLYRLFRAVYKLGGYNRVTNQNQWKSITRRLAFSMPSTPSTHNLVKQAYKKFLHSFEDFYRKLGCTMVNHPRGATRKPRPGRSLIRDKDRNTPVPTSQATTPVPKTSGERDKNEAEEESSVIQVPPTTTVAQPVQQTPEVVSPAVASVPTPSPVHKKTIVEEEKKEKRMESAAPIPAIKEPAKEEEPPKSAKKREISEEVISGQDSDVNVEAEGGESSSSEKSLKPTARFTPVPAARAKSSSKAKDETTKKKIHEKRKTQEASSSASSGSSSSTGSGSSGAASSAAGTASTSATKRLEATSKREDKSKDEEPTKTRSKSKDDATKAKASADSVNRETRTPSREVDKNRGNPTKQRRMTDDELKKRGRKKRENETEKSRPDKDDSSGVESTVAAPTYKGPVELGDRLKVYYGPTHESKVTYEAKVIDIEKDASVEPAYLVHYTGWNTRYDEWIKATRIAQNYTQWQARMKRAKITGRPQTPSSATSKSAKASTSSTTPNATATQSRRRAQQQNSTGGGLSTSAGASSTLGSSGAGVTSSGSSSSGAGKEKDPGIGQPARSTTPLSAASSSSRTKSPATPATSGRPVRNTRNAEHGGVELRRQTRRMSSRMDMVHYCTESDDSEAYEVAEEPRRKRVYRRRVEDRMKNEENSEAEEDEKEVAEEPRRTRRLRRTVTKAKDTAKSTTSNEAEGADEDEEDEEDEEEEEEEADEEDADEDDDADEAEEIDEEPARRGSTANSKISPSAATASASSVPSDSEKPGAATYERSHERSDEQPKGRDFDLLQIRSELKGFDKAVKMEMKFEDSTADVKVKSEFPQDADKKPKEEKKSDVAKSILEYPDTKPTLDPSGAVVATKSASPLPASSQTSGTSGQSTAPTQTPAAVPAPLPAPPTEDVYEFKEPEPFEFEVRNKRDSGGDKDKPKKRVFDEEPKSPKKKQKTLASSSPATKDTKSEADTSVDPRRKVRRNAAKRNEENIEVVSTTVKASISSSGTKENLEKGSSDSSNQPKTLPTPPAPSPPPPPPPHLPPTNVDETKKSNVGALFADLPAPAAPSDENADPDDTEDRLVISETTETTETIFPYQKDAFPIKTNETIVERNEFLLTTDIAKKTNVSTIPTSVITTSTAAISASSTISIERKSLEIPRPSSSNLSAAPTTLPPPLPAATLPATGTPTAATTTPTSTATPTPTMPVPISARLPATSSIEEKLSAAFRQVRSKESKRAEADDAAEKKAAAKEGSHKKAESAAAKRNKASEEQAKLKYEAERKREIEETAKLEEERCREAMRAAIKQKEEELEQLKLRKEAELRKIAEAKQQASTSLDARKQPDKRLDEDWNKRKNYEASTIGDSRNVGETIVRPPSREPEHKENLIAERQRDKRRKIISQEFVDSTDSSDSEQKLVIDSIAEPRDDKIEIPATHYDPKVKTDVETGQQIDAQLTEVSESSIFRTGNILPNPCLRAIQSQSCILTAKLAARADEEGENMSSLLCEEEIPGSPAPAPDSTDQDGIGEPRAVAKDDRAEKKMVLLEMPFASAPTSGAPSSTASVVNVGPNLAVAMSNNCNVPVSVAIQMQHQQQQQQQQQPAVPAPVPRHQAHPLQQQQQQQQPQQLQQPPPPTPPPQPQPQPQQQQMAAPVLAQRRESNEAAPVMDNTPPTTPDSTISNISGSPREEERIGAPSPLSEENVKSHRDSLEAEDSAGKAPSGYSEDDTIANAEVNNSERNSKATVKRSIEDPQSPKKRKRNRKHSEQGGGTGSNVVAKKPLGRPPASGRQTRHGTNTAGSDSDDTSEGSNHCAIGTANAGGNGGGSVVGGNENNAIQNAITELSNSSRSPKPMKYNFFVELDPELDGSQRIAVLQQKLTELRKTYNAVKVELAGIERRRKKLRRREREALKAAKAEMQQACS